MFTNQKDENSVDIILFVQSNSRQRKSLYGLCVESSSPPNVGSKIVSHDINFFYRAKELNIILGRFYSMIISLEPLRSL